MNTSVHLLFALVLSFSLFYFSFASIPICNAGDQAVLLKVKSQFGASGEKILPDWDPSNTCCQWTYVDCSQDDEAEPGRVYSVAIAGGSGLVGQIPEALSELPFLNRIMFFNEPKLVGPIPQSFSKLKMLRTVLLDSNSLTGPIPSFFGQMKDLQQLDLSGNKFTGIIPPSFSGLTKLTQFNVSHNGLTGGVPKLQTKSLTSFDVSFNQLCGAIPNGLQNLGVTSFQNNKCLCGAPLTPCE